MDRANDSAKDHDLPEVKASTSFFQDMCCVSTFSVPRISQSHESCATGLVWVSLFASSSDSSTYLYLQ